MQRGQELTTDLFPSFFKWSDCKSKDEKKWDKVIKLDVKVEAWPAKMKLKF